MSVPIPEFPAYIDSSMLSAFKACPKKFYYSHLRHLHGSGRSIHLVAGGAFAAGLEAARRFAFSPDGSADPDQLLLVALRAYYREWGDFDMNWDHPKSFVNTFAALEQYLTLHHPLLDAVQPMRNEAGEPLVEFSFAIPLPIVHPVTNDPLLFVGRFDMLGTWEDTPVFLDEKTTSALGDSWRKQWDMRGQFLGYCWALQQLGYPVRTAIVRGTAILKTTTNFMTVPVIFPQYLIDRWYTNMLDTVEQLVETYRAEAVRYTKAGPANILEFPGRAFRHSFADACTSYGGCSYQLLCSANLPEDWVGNYEVRQWNPLSPSTLE